MHLPTYLTSYKQELTLYCKRYIKSIKDIRHIQALINPLRHEGGRCGQGMQEEVVLDIANPKKPYVIRMDASKYAVGAVLEQEDDQGNLRPVAFFSRKL